MKYIVGLALLALSACASVPALACDLTWEQAQEQVAQYSPTITEYSATDRVVLSNWYNALPPETDFVFTNVYRLEAYGQIGLAFVIDGCVIAYGRVQQNQLDVLLPQV
jgi:hypothetical protein